jgi:uncharacterized membrane protein YagU involved in acid resistance
MLIFKLVFNMPQLESKSIINGIIGGIVGGVVFGLMMMMTMPGMMEVIGTLIFGQQNLLIGWITHILISIIFGAGFAVGIILLATPLSLDLANIVISLIAGAVYGVVVWIIGPLIIMPLMMGMPLFNINEMALMSLVGHLAFGLVAGGVFGFLSKSE